MNYTTESIVKRYQNGEDLKFLFFWGHTTKPGKITKACFSQWYPCDFEIDGVKYHTTEQWMMAQKAALMHDEETQMEIMSADNPKDYIALGRKVKNFDSQLWDAHKFEIVRRGNIAKFSQNPELLEFLMGTDNAVIVEASPYDHIWGVKLALDNPEIQNPENWKGENLLGFAIMEVRDLLREDRVKEIIM